MTTPRQPTPWREPRPQRVFIPIPTRHWGKQEPHSPAWERRYASLRRDGFTHDEAYEISEGLIGTKSMRRARAVRRKWRDDVRKRFPKLTDKQYEDEVDVLYDEKDWADAYSQFYPEGYSPRYWREE